MHFLVMVMKLRGISCIYNPITKKVVISRDVIFYEQASWDWSIDNQYYYFLFYYKHKR